MKWVIALLLSLTPLKAAELIMVEQSGCPYCTIFNQKIAPIYPKTEIGRQLPLKRMDIRDKHDYKLKSALRFTPTFLIIENNQEIARMEGFASEDFFWARLEKMKP